VINTSNQVTTLNTGGVGSGPISVAVSQTGSNAGYIYVANYTSKSVSVFNPDGSANSTIDLSLIGNPVSVAVSPAGANASDIYIVLDGDLGQVLVYNPAGSRIETIALSGIGGKIAIAPTVTPPT
jgi:6-phosphogluconolactonase (cycloisomerase 2 family)